MYFLFDFCCFNAKICEQRDNKMNVWQKKKKLLKLEIDRQKSDHPQNE